MIRAQEEHLRELVKLINLREQEVRTLSLLRDLGNLDVQDRLVAGLRDLSDLSREASEIAQGDAPWKRDSPPQRDCNRW